MRAFRVSEYDDCVVLEILNDRVKYQFDDWEEMMENLPNLTELS